MERKRERERHRDIEHKIPQETKPPKNELRWQKKEATSQREREIYIYIYICCEVNSWSKFGGFQSQYLGQVKVNNWSKVIFAL